MSQRRIFTWGEKLTDRVEFEEVALKSLDPSHGPKISAHEDDGMTPDDKEDVFVSSLKHSPSFLVLKKRSVWILFVGSICVPKDTCVTAVRPNPPAKPSCEADTLTSKRVFVLDDYFTLHRSFHVNP